MIKIIPKIIFIMIKITYMMLLRNFFDREIPVEKFPIYAVVANFSAQPFQMQKNIILKKILKL